MFHSHSSSIKQIQKLQKEIEEKALQNLEEFDKKIKVSTDNQAHYLREQVKMLYQQFEKLAQESKTQGNISKSMDHFRESLEGVWESMGHLSTKIVKVESMMDLRK